jgi:branched-chain amino acid transport system ATP-binding protein
MLSIKKLSAGYGPIGILHSVDFEVFAHECVALIGWSGSGKTTLLRTIAGVMRPTAGDIYYSGENITAISAPQRVAKGIALAPEGRHLFAGMTVYENILVGAHLTSKTSDVDERARFVFALFPILKARSHQIAGTLSGGEQQMCAIARAMMSNPALLLIDELSLGLAPLIVARLVEAVAVIRQTGTTIVVVEQDTQLALSISDRAYVMQQGQVQASAPSQTLMEDPMIRHNYTAHVREA